MASLGNWRCYTFGKFASCTVKGQAKNTDNTHQAVASLGNWRSYTFGKFACYTVQ